MKPFLAAALCLLALFCSACSQKADPIVLPPQEKVTEIRVTGEEGSGSRQDPDWIASLLEALSSSEPTSIPSVQDSPGVPGCLQIDFLFPEGESTVFLYQREGAYYVEQPYQGVYRASPQVEELLGL